VGVLSPQFALKRKDKDPGVYLMVHAPKSFWPALNQGDAAILFSFVFLYLAFAGPGAWSFDAILRKAPAKTPQSDDAELVR
jgi:putative oxidoreductase